MPLISPIAMGGCDLESVITTPELDRRAARPADRRRETRAILALLKELARSPEDFFPKLVETALELSNAESTGISLLDEEQKRFVWPAVAGGLKAHIGGGTPRDFGPCGTVLDRDCPLLFSHPERYFTYLEPIRPALEEALLIPFHLDNKPVGTIWAVIHTPDRKFDTEDRRVLQNLSSFAASAYRVLSDVGALKPMLRVKPM